MAATETRRPSHAEAANIKQISSHKYTCNIHPDFCYVKAAHGGSVVSILWRVLAEHYRTTLARQNQPDTVNLHVEFLRGATIGEAEVVVEDVRLGNSSSTVMVKGLQGGKERVVGYFTLVNHLSTRDVLVNILTATSTTKSQTDQVSILATLSTLQSRLSILTSSKRTKTRTGSSSTSPGTQPP
jgi:hypothetical protein